MGTSCPHRSRPDHRGTLEATAEIKSFDHVGITVHDLESVAAFSSGSAWRSRDERLRADGYGLVGGIGQHENSWLMAYVRGPEGIVISLSERIG
jgi:hypothetical protein